MADIHRLVNPRKILVKDLNDHLTCSLCGGYFIDATTLVDCLHNFCRACIVRHFESSKLCPNCGAVVHKSKPLTCLRNDTVLQALVYKLVPALYSKELQRRADFYHSTSLRPNSSCSDDSVLGDREDSEVWALSKIGDPNLYFSPDDSISLSLEYYQHKLESDTSAKPETEKDLTTVSEKESEVKISENTATKEENNAKDNTVNVKDGTVTAKECLPVTGTCVDAKQEEDNGNGTYKRYLQCPAAVTMSHIMKFLRMKYALTHEHRVDIIYNEEVLPQYYSLMDVAYTFNWKKEGPMRLYFRIFVPVIRPEVPVIPVKQEVAIIAPEKPVAVKAEPKPIEVVETKTKNKEITKPIEKETIKVEKTDEQEEVAKEEPKKVEKSVKFSDKVVEKVVKAEKTEPKKVEVKPFENCVFDYMEPDKEEIKAFAERRDREWAMQKQEEEYNHVTKKRKKNKHSKSEFMHKKRKLHAEITSNTEILSKSEDSLKLKVKLSVPNGHKHKHRNFDLPKTQELSPKERLLQMRQVRHKKIDEKSHKSNKFSESPPIQQYKIVPMTEKVEKVEKKEDIKTESPKIEPEVSGKTLRSDFSAKTTLSKDLCNRLVSVNVERCADGAKNQAKKVEKIPENKPNGENKVIKVSDIPVEVKQEKKEDKTKEKLTLKVIPKEEKMEDTPIIQRNSPHEFVTKNFTVSKIEQGVKRKIDDKQKTIDKRPSLEITLINPPVQRTQTISSCQAKQVLQKPEVVKVNKTIRPPPPTIPLVRIQKSLNLKSGISIIPKMPEKCDNIGALDLSAKPNKNDKKLPDFRPKSASPRPVVNSPMISRPNSASPKIGNSILSPKTPLKGLTEPKIEPKSDKISPNISNLQLLSESAVQIRELMAKNATSTPPIPNLIKKSPQLKIPVPQNSGLKQNFVAKQNFMAKNMGMMPKVGTMGPKIGGFIGQKGPNFVPKTLQKLPKLNEINKSQFSRLNTNQIRNARPAQNQTIRNIPNPSLLVRQQNQNRINLLSAPNNNTESNKDGAKNVDKIETKTQMPALKTLEAASNKKN